MDVLKFLKCIRNERLEIISLKETRDDIYYSLMPSGIRYDLDKVQTSPVDRMPAVAGNLAEIQTILDGRIEKLSEDLVLANRVIDQVPTPECRQLLALRYLADQAERRYHRSGRRKKTVDVGGGIRTHGL